MNSKTELYRKLKCQLAIDFNCAPEDFTKPENIVTVPAKNDGRRCYIEGTFFFQMLTLGENAVISADLRLHPWLNEFVKDKKGHHLFEYRNLRQMEEQTMRYGKRLWQTHHMFLPRMERMEIPELLQVQWFEQKDLHSFYSNKRFPNALCNKFEPERPDILAVCAFEGTHIIAMAGCSADTPDFWQIGIDVDSAYQGRGIGTYLVKLLKNEIMNRGKIPFYGTSLSNLRSWNIALNSGFFPAWVEIETIESNHQ